MELLPSTPVGKYKVVKMTYFSNLYQTIKLGILFYNCELPEKFVPPEKNSILIRIFRGKRKKNKTFSNVLESLGPSYIKLGQFLATRPDIIGREQANELSFLQDNLPTFNKDISIGIIESEFNTKVEDVYDEFGDAIAAASIAQVHKALINKEQKVAVKILRPSVDRKFKKDFEYFYFIADLFEKINPELKRLKFKESIMTMQRSVQMEMDLRFEAAAISEISNNMQTDDEYVVPRVFWEKTTKKILTIEWIDGISIKDRDLLIKNGFNLKELARIVIQSFLTQALRNGFFHADMHQGNLLVNTDGKLVILDFGIMGRLGEKEQNFLAEILWGLITKNYKRAAEIHFEAGYVPKDQRLDEFSQALRAIGEPLTGKKANDISMANVLTQLFEVTEQFQMETRPELLLLQKTMVVTEGVARDLDPDLNMWDIAKPVVSKWMEEKISPEKKIKKTIEDISKFGSAINDLPELIHSAKIANENFHKILDAKDKKREKQNFFMKSFFWIITLFILLCSIIILLD